MAKKALLEEPEFAYARPGEDLPGFFPLRFLLATAAFIAHADLQFDIYEGSRRQVRCRSILREVVDTTVLVCLPSFYGTKMSP